MVKKVAKRSKESKKSFEVGRTITTKSQYGSHADMLVEELPDGKVLLKDDNGTYITEKSCLDNGLADPRRYSGRIYENI